MTSHAHRLDGIAQNYFQLGKVAQFMGLPALLNYAAELHDGELIKTIETSVAPVPEFQTKKFGSIFDFRFYRILMYAMVRALRPSLFVESGVLHGLTTIFILHALERNAHGMLISADLPSYPETGPSNDDGCIAVLPKGKEPGWVIPVDKRGRWKFVKGASSRVLPSVLAAADTEVDIFLHDSEHTTKTMQEELQLGWRVLKRGGVLVCDNFDMSSAFTDLVQHERNPFVALSTCDSNYLERVNLALAVKQ
jgi:predicted O-methyltransferase YrrM